MKLTKYIRIPLILFVVFTLLGLLSEMYILNSGIREQDMRRFSRTLHRKQKAVNRLIEDVAYKLGDVNHKSIGEVFDDLKDNNELFEHKELTVLVTKNDELLYWSDHVVGFQNEISQANEGYVELPNGLFVLQRLKKGDITINGLVLIKYNYKIENQYLRNTFAKGFHLPDDFEVHFYESENAYPIYDVKGRFLFSLEPSGVLPCIYSDLFFPVSLFLVALLFLFTLIYRLMTHYWHGRREIKLLLLLFVLLGAYSFMNATHLPRSVYMLKLFSPNYFAYSSFWTSLGEFWVFSLFIMFWGINFIRTFDIRASIKENHLKRRISLSVWLVQVAVLFVLIRFMMQTLIMNSSVSFAVYRIEEVSIYSLIGFFAIGFLYLGFFFFALRTVQVFRRNSSIKEFLIILTVVTASLVLLFQWIDTSESLRLSLYFWVIMASGFLIVKGNITSHRLSVIVTFVFVFTLFSLFNLIEFQEDHEKMVQENTALNLSTEHDPTAEIYLLDIDAEIKSDTFLVNQVMASFDFVSNYLEQRYFTGYLREYDLQITICDEMDSLLIQPENVTRACVPFFAELLDDYGSDIPGTNFYFLDNMNGRVTYFGQYEFESENGHIALFLELNSKLKSEGTGFPELLLPQHSIESRIRNNFSFAKYSKGELVDRGGDFLYALTSRAYQLPNEELSFNRWDGYEHCIYRVNDNGLIIVSRPYIHLTDYFIAFPYIFVFLFILSLLVNYITRPYLKFTGFKGSLRMRIQLSIIGVVFTTLLVVGSGTVLYNISQYRFNHRQDLIDKINSVSVEVDLVMGDIEDFNGDLLNFLSYDLVRISDIFWTDINIYDLSGTLLVSSRPEVFAKGLISRQMDNTAIHFLNKYQPTRFLHEEHIAKMEYLSAYVPLINYAGKNIGYLNLPYFTKERQFRQEITTFILAFINIYVFLLLASILVAYFISARITDPLKMIRENLRMMQLGRDTQKIEYNSDDEIGDLVKEYNNKVEELALNAGLLAKSERETAWREMAKQIAHEIKNPLTPMKLNLQFLQRSNPEAEDYQEKLKKVSETMIEQIDNLSSIATEFSNFAKIPKAKNEQFNLAQRLEEIVKLYNYTGQVTINRLFKNDMNDFVYADKEQFSRAILNLLKNAIQAIPENINGEIDLHIRTENQEATISIKDNGKGIPIHVRDSIFVPNFTTKSSGAGLGLAITKNIVENFNGEIWFESTVGVGTTFFIKIPLISKSNE